MARHRKTKTIDASLKTKTISDASPLAISLAFLMTSNVPEKRLPPKHPLEGIAVYPGLPPKDPKKEHRKPIKKGKK